MVGENIRRRVAAAAAEGFGSESTMGSGGLVVREWKSLASIAFVFWFLLYSFSCY